MSRIAGAIDAVREIVAEAACIDAFTIADDDDLLEDLGLKTLELVSVGLILEEIFSIHVPDDLFETPLYRSPASIAEWAIRQSEAASYFEAHREKRRA